MESSSLARLSRSTAAAPPRQKSWTPCRNRNPVNSATGTTFLASVSRHAPYCRSMSVPYLKEAAAAGEMEKLIRFVRLHLGDGNEEVGRKEIDKSWIEA